MFWNKYINKKFYDKNISYIVYSDLSLVNCTKDILWTSRFFLLIAFCLSFCKFKSTFIFCCKIVNPTLKATQHKVYEIESVWNLNILLWHWVKTWVLNIGKLYLWACTWRLKMSVHHCRIIMSMSLLCNALMAKMLHACNLQDCMRFSKCMNVCDVCLQSLLMFQFMNLSNWQI